MGGRGACAARRWCCSRCRRSSARWSCSRLPRAPAGCRSPAWAGRAITWCRRSRSRCRSRRCSSGCSRSRSPTRCDRPSTTAARARGIPDRRIVWRHGWRQSLGPVLAIYGVIVGSLFSGSFAVEIVTSWPGLGELMRQALMARDTYLVAGCAAAGAAFLAAGVLAADVAHALVDPRIGGLAVPKVARRCAASRAARRAGRDRAVARALQSRAPVLRLPVRAADAAAPRSTTRGAGTRRSPIRSASSIRSSGATPRIARGS